MGCLQHKNMSVKRKLKETQKRKLEGTHSPRQTWEQMYRRTEATARHLLERARMPREQPGQDKAGSKYSDPSMRRQHALRLHQADERHRDHGTIVVLGSAIIRVE